MSARRPWYADPDVRDPVDLEPGEDSEGASSSSSSSTAAPVYDDSPKRAESFPTVLSTGSETPILNIPWGPNVDVIFDPRGNAAYVGGKVVLYGQDRGTRAKISSVTITDASQAVALSGGFGCESYVVTAQLGSAQPTPTLEARCVGKSYSGRQGGGKPPGPKLLSLVAGNVTTQAGSVAKQVMGRVYFDPSKYNANDVTFRVLLATSDVAEPAFVDLYDENGITNEGVPRIVPGSQMSVSSLAATLAQIDLFSLAAATSAGSLAVRMWLNPATGGSATLSEAQLEVT